MKNILVLIFSISIILSSSCSEGDEMNRELSICDEFENYIKITNEVDDKEFIIKENLVAAADPEHDYVYYSIAQLNEAYINKEVSVCDNLDDLLGNEDEEVDKFYIEFEIDDEDPDLISIEGFYFSEEIFSEYELSYNGSHDSNVNIESINWCTEGEGRLKGVLQIMDDSTTDEVIKLISVEFNITACRPI